LTKTGYYLGGKKCRPSEKENWEAQVVETSPAIGNDPPNKRNREPERRKNEKREPACWAMARYAPQKWGCNLGFRSKQNHLEVPKRKKEKVKITIKKKLS